MNNMVVCFLSLQNRHHCSCVMDFISNAATSLSKQNASESLEIQRHPICCASVTNREQLILCCSVFLSRPRSQGSFVPLYVSASRLQIDCMHANACLSHMEPFAMLAWFGLTWPGLAAVQSSAMRFRKTRRLKAVLSATIKAQIRREWPLCVVAKTRRSRSVHTGNSSTATPPMAIRLWESSHRGRRNFHPRDEQRKVNVPERALFQFVAADSTASNGLLP
jgi:hypothetical protein